MGDIPILQDADHGGSSRIKDLPDALLDQEPATFVQLNDGLAGKSDTSHNHSGVYEPIDGTILKDADIDVTVQGYTAALAAVTGTNTGDEPVASLTVSGTIEIATGAETNTGTDATRAVSPDGLDDWTGSPQVTDLGTIGTGVWQGTAINQTYLVGQSGTNTGDEDTASVTVSGISESATIAEVDAGTDAVRHVTPDSLQGSALQTKVDAITGTNTGDEPVASLTVSGTIEIATGAETNTGTDTTRAVSPDGLDDWTGSTQIDTVGTIGAGIWQGSAINQTYLVGQSGTNTGDEPAASVTVSGVSESATIAEVDAGTDAVRHVTPDSLQGSALQTKVDAITGTNTGDEPVASLTVSGTIEIATGAETNTGTDATRAVSPDGLDDWTGSAQVTDLGTIGTGVWQGTAINQTYLVGQSGTNTGDEPDASVTVAGVSESATAAEVDTGTDAVRHVTPDSLQGSALQTKVDGIETAATADQTDGEIKTAYENNANTNVYTDAEQTKMGHISVTQAVDLDQMETDIAAAAGGMTYQGDWDASAGSFPGGGSAQTGAFYYVSVGGTVDSVVFTAGDNIVATTDNASTSTYAANWSKHDQTDAVQSVAGKLGAVTLVTDDVTESTDKNYVTDAEGVVLGNTSGTNSGDEPTASISVSGISESATAGEVDTGTDAVRHVTPSSLAGSALQTKVDAITGTNTGDEPVASLTVSGTIEIATGTETNTGTDATRAVSPDGLNDWTGSAQIDTLGTIGTGVWQGTAINQTYLVGQSGTNTGDEPTASTTVSGISESATATEVNTGSDAIRHVTPSSLAGSALQTKVDAITGTNTGDEPVASLTVSGTIEIATITETNTGTDATRAVSPDGLDGWTGSTALVTLGTIGTGVWQGTAINQTYLVGQSGTNTGDEPTASTTVSGISESATATEVNTGSDAIRHVTPSSLAGSSLQSKVDGISSGADVTGTTNVNNALNGMTPDHVATTTSDRVAFWDASQSYDWSYRTWANVITDLGLAKLASPTFTGTVIGAASTWSGLTTHNGGIKLNNSDVISMGTASSRDKYRIYSNSTYAIGMQSAVTYGACGNWCMTFQMNNTATHGFWWGDDADTAAQGAMSLTTIGQLTVASSIYVGGGKSVTTDVAGAHELYITGTGKATADIDALDFNATSDINKKTNIHTIKNATETLSKFRGVTFDWKDEEELHEKVRGEASAGVIAQEVEEHIPTAVSGEEGNKTVSYNQLVGYLIESNKELQARIEKLEAQIGNTN